MKKILPIAVAFLSAALLFGTLGPIVGAQSAGLGITPSVNLDVQAGNEVSGELFINNLSSSQDLTLEVQLVDFQSVDETGTPALQLDPDAPQTSWSLKPFIDIQDVVELEAGETKYIPYTISIPENQGAGSYYSAIRYVATNANDGGNVVVSASGATLVFVTVPGQTNEVLNLQDFGTYESSSDGRSGEFKSVFINSKPLEFAYILENRGNVAERPTGSIIITNMFGQQVKLIEDINPKSSLALIGQTRRFQTCITPPEKQVDPETGNTQTLTSKDEQCQDSGLAPGRYTATMSAFYGINGNNTQEISATTTFWYLPTWFLVTVFLVLVVLGVSGFLIYRKVRGKKGISVNLRSKKRR